MKKPIVHEYIIYLYLVSSDEINTDSMNGQPPAYMCNMLTPYKPDRCQRSSSRALLVVPKTRLVTKGDCAFAVLAPKLWNSLPGYLSHLLNLFLKLTFIIWFFVT